MRQDVNNAPAGVQVGDSPYEVKLDGFYGPVELLLYLIRRDEIDICDIPIAYIADQYLEYVKMMQMLDLEGAGQFLMMAATLMRVKSQMLLPFGSAAGEDAEEDPRNELVRRLMEYQQYRAMSSVLAQREEEQAGVFYHAGLYDAGRRDGPVEEASLFDLLAAFQGAMRRALRGGVCQVGEAGPAIEERMEYLLARIAEKKRICFGRLVRGMSRTVLVVTFAGLLELVKNRKVRARQKEAFGDIWLYRTHSDASHAV